MTDETLTTLAFVGLSGTVTNGGPGVGNFAGSIGTYSLNGGTLVTRGTSGAYGTSTFNLKKCRQAARSSTRPATTSPWR